jgi:hypothetical protein
MRRHVANRALIIAALVAIVSGVLAGQSRAMLRHAILL